MRVLFVIVFFSTYSFGHAQYNAIGVKSYSFHPGIFISKESPNIQQNYYSNSSFSSMTSVFYERFVAEKDYLVGMIYYRQQNSVQSRIFQFNSGIRGFDTVRSNSNFLRVDIGGGRLLRTQKELSLKINATAFYQFTLKQKSVSELTFLDSNDLYLGEEHLEVYEPNISQVGVSIMPQFYLSIWKNLSLIFDIRIDFFSQFSAGHKGRTVVDFDEFSNQIGRTEIKTYETERVFDVLDYYGIGLSYRF